jgi:hypothetical protein
VYDLANPLVVTEQTKTPRTSEMGGVLSVFAEKALRRTCLPKTRPDQTGGGLRVARLRRRPRLLSLREQYSHDGVGPDTVQRRQRGKGRGCRILRASGDGRAL